jgi:hypothetical protein
MARRSWAWLIVVACASLALLSACASNEITGQVVQNSLVVVTTCPESGDSTVALFARPFVVFDQAPSSTDMTTTTFGVEHDGAPVAGNVLKLNDHWVFVPSQPLTPGGQYHCSVAVGVRLEEGRLVRDFVQWDFKAGDQNSADSCRVQ